MPNLNETIGPELFVAVREAIETTTGVNFADFFKAYREKNSDQPELTEKDLIVEILEAGGYQAEDDATFEDAVMIGSLAMGEDFGLF